MSSPSANAGWRRSSPKCHKWKFVSALVCKVAFKHFPQPLRSHPRIFGTLGQLLKIPTFVNPNIAECEGKMASLIFFIGVLIFLWVRSPGWQTHSARTNVICLQCLKVAHALRSDQNILLGQWSLVIFETFYQIIFKLLWWWWWWSTIYSTMKLFTKHHK